MTSGDPALAVFLTYRTRLVEYAVPIVGVPLVG